MEISLLYIVIFPMLNWVSTSCIFLQHCAPILFLLLDLKCGSGGGFKHFPHSLLGLGRALEVAKGIDLLSHGTPFVRFDWLLLHLRKLSLCVFIVTQILLVSNQDDGNIWTKVLHLWGPLLGDIFQRVWGVYGKAHKNDICVWVGERSQSVVILLSSCIPQC